ncbi:MAG: HAD-IA family hydrolase [Phycisphaerae bacterium]|nr:HAD-IA family hydrolase [Phycisphaerae bacterium]
MTHKSAFVFDLDGTLVDSLRDIANALNSALAELKKSPATVDEVRRWIGDGLPTLCQRACPTADTRTLERLVRSATTHYRTHCTDHTRPYPKVLQTLNLLSRRRMPMAVLSNKPHALTVHVAEQLGLQRYFADIRGYIAEQDRKPSPRIALQIVRRLNVQPRAAFFIGDSSVDIQTARNAGMIGIAVTWGFRSKVELQAAGPDFLIEDPAEILELPARIP